MDKTFPFGLRFIEIAVIIQNGFISVLRCRALLAARLKRQSCTFALLVTTSLSEKFIELLSRRQTASHKIDDVFVFRQLRPPTVIRSNRGWMTCRVFNQRF